MKILILAFVMLFTTSNLLAKNEINPKDFVISKKMKGKKFKKLINFLKDSPLEIEVELFKIKNENRASWQGVVVGKEDSQVLISKYRNALVIDIVFDGKHFQVTPSKGNTYKIEETDMNLVNSLGAKQDAAQDPISGGNVQDLNSTATGDTNATIVDVLLVFANDTAQKYSSSDAMIAAGDNMESSFNSIANSSDLNVQIRVVHQHVSPTNSHGSGLINDLTRARNAGDGYFDEIFNLRDQVGADLVSIITTTSDYCGYGYYNSWVTAVNVNCAISNKSFAHELGHNFGSYHDRDNSSTLSFNHGHRFNGLSGKLYRTVMAYSPGTRIGKFSNPNILHDGVPSGVVDMADNVRQISAQAINTAKFRESVQAYNEAYLEVNSNTLNFGNINIGESKDLTLNLSNLGLSDLIINSTSASSNEFKIISNNCLNLSIAYQGSCSIAIRFTPTSELTFDSSLEISANATNGSLSVALIGNGVLATPNISIPSSYSFGKINIGNTVNQTISISNNGTASLDISGIVISQNPVFRVTNDSCSGKTISANSSCSISVSFSPLAAENYSATISISSNDPDNGDAKLLLAGSGASPKGKGKSGGGSGGGGKGRKK